MKQLSRGAEHKGKRGVRILILILLLILVLFLLAILKLASLVMTGKRQTAEEAMEWQSAHYDTSFYEELEKTDYTVTGFDDYLLHVQLLKNPENTDRYVIISHGNTDNHIGSLKYVPTYMDLGYNCIIYDLRGHGDNERTFTTYGILEGKDLARLIEDTRERYPDLQQLGLHGESLGASTTISSLEYQPEVDFAVSDCAFSDLENVLREGYRSVHLPAFLVDLADIGTRIRYRYAIKDMRPIDALDENRIPILFIHGAEDKLINPENAQALYDRTKGIREIHLIPGAGHAESILTAPKEYREYVSSFLERLS